MNRNSKEIKIGIILLILIVPFSVYSGVHYDNQERLKADFDTAFGGNEYYLHSILMANSCITKIGMEDIDGDNGSKIILDSMISIVYNCLPLCAPIDTYFIYIREESNGELIKKIGTSGYSLILDFKQELNLPDKLDEFLAGDSVGRNIDSLCIKNYLYSKMYFIDDRLVIELKEKMWDNPKDTKGFVDSIYSIFASINSNFPKTVEFWETKNKIFFAEIRHTPEVLFNYQYDRLRDSVNHEKYYVDVTTYIDEFDNYKIDRMTENQISLTMPAGGLGSYEKFHLKMQRFKSENGKASYSLIVDYIGEDWFFIERGESLILLVDGERISFNTLDGSAGNSEVLSGGTVRERAIYSYIPYRTFKKIAQASVIKIKILGSKKFVTGYATIQNMKNFRNFVNQYMP